MASKQKAQGRKWEKYWIDFFATLFDLKERVINKKTKLPNFDWEIARAEEVSQVYDNLGMDMVFKEQKKYPFAVQIKSTSTRSIKSKPIDIQPLMEIKCNEDKIPLLCTTVLHTKKGNKRRSHYGDYITIKAEDFQRLLNADYIFIKLNKNEE